MPTQKKDKRKTGTDRSAVIGRPRLEALLFCDWANETAEHKHNLIGSFDHVYVDAEERMTPAFWIYVKVGLIQPDVLTLHVYDPTGTLSVDASFTLHDVPAVGDDMKVQGDTTTFKKVQIVNRIQFRALMEGEYWFDVSFKGERLGGAPLSIEYRSLAIEKEHEGTDNGSTSGS